MSTVKALGLPNKIKALGLGNAGGIDKSQQKSLSIIYKSCAKDDKFIYLYFDVYSKTLNNNKAQVYVDELDGYLNDTAVPKTEVTISLNSGVGIMLKFDKNKDFTETFYDDGNVFQATITCDGLSSKTSEFKLNFSNVRSTSKTCFCKRDMSAEELKNIIIELRKKEIIEKNAKKIRNSNGKPILKNGREQFTDLTMYDDIKERLFDLDYPERLKNEDANFTKFSKELNKAFNKYEINTCIRKIHFLAQCYHETQRFLLTYEKEARSNYHGGEHFRGRGLIQVTHDDWGYLPYYKYLNPSCTEKTNPIDRTTLFYKNTLKPFSTLLATNISYACDSAGWKWKYEGVPSVGKNINLLADSDDVMKVSKAINGDVKGQVPNGFTERKQFTDILKKVMNYEQCKNNK